jgi:uncharacterized protein YndB with AHSA1/START domain
MTMHSLDIEPVVRTVTVAVPIQRAWNVFTRDFSTWWPATHHISTEPMETCLIEPREGGRWYEVGSDGSECDWGVVVAWEPPLRLMLSWQIGSDWKYEPDPMHASEIEVLFTPDGPNATRVDLEHRGFERHAAGATEMRAAIDGKGGWGDILERFARAV